MGSRRDDIPPAPARRTIAAIAACCLLALPVAHSAAQSIDDLNSRIAGARSEAESLGAEIEAASAELATAQSRAVAAAEREAQLSAVLARGQEREARRENEVGLARAQLRVARSQLQRSLDALADRLVEIYRGGMPDATTLLLEADGFDDLVTRAEYLNRIQDADASLVARVRSLRDAVSERLAAVEDAEQRAEDFNLQIAAARDEIAAVRAEAKARKGWMFDTYLLRRAR